MRNLSFDEARLLLKASLILENHEDSLTVKNLHNYIETQRLNDLAMEEEQGRAEAFADFVNHANTSHKRYEP